MPHDLQGLIRFAERVPWCLMVRNKLSVHIGDAAQTVGLELDEMLDALGDHWTNTLWGCAFEDVLTQEDELDGNIVDEYLKRRGWKETARSKAYMKALRVSAMSLYEVSEVIPGTGFVARDLILGGEPIQIIEKSGSANLRQWDRIAGRLTPVMGRNLLAGGMLPFSRGAQEGLFDSLKRVFGDRNAQALPPITHKDLQEAAALFTQSWLFDKLDALMAPEVITVSNGDGEQILFHETRLPLKSKVTQGAIAQRLAELSELRRADAKFWNWIGPATPAEMTGENNLSLDTTLDDGVRVLGNVELSGRSIHLHTNSRTRADRAILLLQNALGDLVGTPSTEVETLDERMARSRAAPIDAGRVEVPALESEREIHAYLDRHYRAALDIPIGMLENKSPRQCVRSSRGRTLAADWLKFLENETAHRPDRDDPLVTYDIGWIWIELGIEDLRR